MAWYRTGTVNVTNGSPNVVGVGTAWVQNVLGGHGFIGPDGFTREILSVTGDGAMTLAAPYTGTTLIGASYSIIPTQGAIQAFVAPAQQLVTDFASVRDNAGTGQFTDGTAAVPGVRFAADVDCGFYRIAANTIGLATAGVERLRLDGAGTIEQRGSQATPVTLRMRNDNGGTAAGTKFVVGNFAGTDTAYLQDQTDGAFFNLKIWKQSAGYMAFGTNDTERLRIDANGNVGIGRASAGEKLSVDGNLVVGRGSGGSGYDVSVVTSTGGMDLRAVADGTSGLGSFGTVSNHPFYLFSNDTLRMRFDVLGNIILRGTATVPALSNGDMVFNLISNTLARLTYRGSDGVNRHADLVLAP